jgi:hypothetical protein
MVENEESVGDYLLNKAQDKINAYLEKTGVPAEIGGVIDQIGILSNNSVIKSVIENSGIKGVYDQQVEALSRTVGDLKGQLQSLGQNAAATIDRQVAAAQQSARPLLQQSQSAIDTASRLETQTRAAVETAQQLPAQAQARLEQGVEQVRTGVENVASQAQARVEQGVEQVRTGVDQIASQAQARVEQGVEQVRTGVENVASQAQAGARGAMDTLSPEYLRNLSDSELRQLATQSLARKASLREQFEGSDPDRQELFERLTSEGRAERLAYRSEAERRGLFQREQPPTQTQQPGVSEEPNVRPSEVSRTAPEFESPAQQLPQQRPQVPQAEPPTTPEEPATAPRPPQTPSEIEPATAPRPPQTPSEIEPAIGPEPRPEGFVEPVAQEGEAVAQAGERAEQAISTTAKVGTTLEETTGSLPGIGEAGEVLGALLQIGSLIASAFKPHESTPIIETPVSGFGFGSLNQFGVGGSSIV